VLKGKLILLMVLICCNTIRAGCSSLRFSKAENFYFSFSTLTSVDKHGLQVGWMFETAHLNFFITAQS